jgi:hypothetical protein
MRRDALFAAYHARDMFNVVYDSIEVGLLRVRTHVFRNKVDLRSKARQLSPRHKRRALLAEWDSYHHHPVALAGARADMPKHLVRHVPRDVAHRAGTGVAPYHRRTRDLEHSERSGVRCVRKVDEDAKTIEFPNQHFAELAVAAIFNLAP